VFFNLWKANLNKLKKDDGIQDSGNPLGAYLADLDEYLRNPTDSQIVQTTEDCRPCESVDNSDFFKRLSLESLFEQQTVTEPTEFNV